MENFKCKSAFRVTNGVESKCASSNCSLVESLKISTPEKQPIQFYDQKRARKKCWCLWVLFWGVPNELRVLGMKVLLEQSMVLKVGVLAPIVV